MSNNAAQINPEINFNYKTFEEFWECQLSPAIIIVYYVLSLFSTITLILFNTVTDEKKQQFILFARLLFYIPVFLHIYTIMKQNFFHSWPKLPLRTVYLCSFNIVTWTLMCGISLIAASTRPNCDLPNCIPVTEHALQPNILLALFTSSIVGPVALKVHHTNAVFLSFFITVGSTFISCVIVNASFRTYRMLSICLLMQCIVLYDHERSLRRLYEDNQHLSATMLAKLEAENEKKLVQLRSEEMRMLIGNVAHDLKSPLQAFMSELDTLLHYFTKMYQTNPNQSNLTQSTITSSTISLSTQSAIVSAREDKVEPPIIKPYVLINPQIEYQNTIESVLLLKSICSFMAMMINRAIDFTKISSGFELQAHSGLVNLYEVMNWVIECTSKSASGIPIKLEPLPDDMCSHVLTDPQWFSENLLCLVSNAQKFTTEGVITISCRLVLKKDNLTQVPSTSSSHSKSFFKSGRVLSNDNYMIRVEVEDEGIGIPKDKRNDLFQPFKQAQQRAGGTGLGLFSLRKRVEQLKGQCGILDRHDGRRGCRFWFTIPYIPDEASAAESLEVVHENNSSRCYPSSEIINRTDSRVNILISKHLDDTDDVVGDGLILVDHDNNDINYGKDNNISNNNKKNKNENENKYNVEPKGKEPINDNYQNSEEDKQKIQNDTEMPSYIRINAKVKAYDQNDFKSNKKHNNNNNVNNKNKNLSNVSNNNSNNNNNNNTNNTPSKINSKTIVHEFDENIDENTNIKTNPSLNLNLNLNDGNINGNKDQNNKDQSVEVVNIDNKDQQQQHHQHQQEDLRLDSFRESGVNEKSRKVLNSDFNSNNTNNNNDNNNNNNTNNNNTNNALCVLVVEDVPLIQKTTCRALQREGFEVDLAWNGAECLKMVRRKKYNVILMDLQMPVMDGLEACRRLRLMERGIDDEQPNNNNNNNNGIIVNNNVNINNSNDIDNNNNNNVEVRPRKRSGISTLISTVSGVSLSDCGSELEKMEYGESGYNIYGNNNNNNNKGLRGKKYFIMGISANGDDRTRQDALDAGMDEFIPKPISMSSFKDCLTRNNIS